MHVRELLTDLFSRVDEEFSAVLERVDTATLNKAPAPGTNSIAWLLWHLTRVQDDHLAKAAALPQRWHAEDFFSRSELDLAPDDIGYGHSVEQAESIRFSGPSFLADYREAVQGMTATILSDIDAEALDRVVDRAWNPPVTFGVRLVSVASDCLQHLGQAAYLQGLYKTQR